MLPEWTKGEKHLQLSKLKRILITWLPCTQPYPDPNSSRQWFIKSQIPKVSLILRYWFHKGTSSLAQSYPKPRLPGGVHRKVGPQRPCNLAVIEHHWASLSSTGKMNIMPIQTIVGRIQLNEIMLQQMVTFNAGKAVTLYIKNKHLVWLRENVLIVVIWT